MGHAGCFAAGMRRLRRSRSLTASPARKLCRQAIKALLRSGSNVSNLHSAFPRGRGAANLVLAAEPDPGEFGQHGRRPMKMSRRESMQLSASALPGLSLAALKTSQVAAQAPPAAQPERLVDTQLRNIPSLPLKPDGSAPEYTPQEAGQITGVLWRTRGQTPQIEFDYNKMKIKLDARG